MTNTPSLHFSTADPTPPYEQLRRQLVDLIGSNVLKPGDRLPPLRQLATDLGLAVGTVARTYRELEAAGLIASRRGGGTRVQETASRRTDQQIRQALAEHAHTFVQQARLLGAGDTVVREVIEQAITPGQRSLGP